MPALRPSQSYKEHLCGIGSGRLMIGTNIGNHAIRAWLDSGSVGPSSAAGSSQGRNPPPSAPVYSHAWSPTAAALSRASAEAARSCGRLRYCSPSLVRRSRWRRLPRALRPRRRRRPSLLRLRRPRQKVRRATVVPRPAAGVRQPRRRRHRRPRQRHPSPRPERRRHLRSPRRRAVSPTSRPNPRALRRNDRRRHRPARLELFRSARS